MPDLTHPRIKRAVGDLTRKATRPQEVVERPFTTNVGEYRAIFPPPLIRYVEWALETPLPALRAHESENAHRLVQELMPCQMDVVDINAAIRILKALDVSLSPDTIRFPIDVFCEEPPAVTRPFQLQGLYLFGLDLKINSDGEVKLIEVNGFNSGVRGLRRTRTSAEAPEVPLTRSDKALDRYLSSFGDATLLYLGSRLAFTPFTPFRLPACSNLIQYELRRELGIHAVGIPAIHPRWRTLDMLADSIMRSEACLHDKKATALLLAGDGDIKPTTLPATSGNLERIIEENPDLRFVVCKPRNGSLGNGVQIFPVAEADAALAAQNRLDDPEYIIEPFVESRGVRSRATGKIHDACSRYVVLAEIDDAQNIVVRHFGGYWRLCREPIAAYGSIEAMRANLSAGALAQPLEPGDQALLSAAADSIGKRLASAILQSSIFYRSG